MDDLHIDMGGGSPDATVVHVSGELDRAAVPALQSVLSTLLDADPRAETLIIDLAAITFLDAGGLNLLLDTQRRATAGGTGFCLARCSRPVLRTLQITRTAELVRLIPRHGS